MTAQSPRPFPFNGQRKLTAQENFERTREHPRLLLSGRRLIALAITLFLVACQPSDETVAVPYGAVNHTDVGIAFIAIDGRGTVLAPPKHGEAGGACCVVVPKVWRPNLKVTIEWRENGTFLKDANGNEVSNDGVPALIEGSWKSRTVHLPRYEPGGRLYVFFFPRDEVRVAMTTSPEWDAWDAPSPADTQEQDRRFGKRSQ